MTALKCRWIACSCFYFIHHFNVNVNFNYVNAGRKWRIRKTRLKVLTYYWDRVRSVSNVITRARFRNVFVTPIHFCLGLWNRKIIPLRIRWFCGWTEVQDAALWTVYSVKTAPSELTQREDQCSKTSMPGTRYLNLSCQHNYKKKTCCNNFSLL